MALEDIVTFGLLASSVFLVVVAFGLLLRYRQVSQRMSSSTDLGRDLWDALEKRMRKQDERILDMMGRLDVLQTRVVAMPGPISTPVEMPTAAPLSSQPMMEERPKDVTASVQVAQQASSQAESQRSQSTFENLTLDETQIAAIRLLAQESRNTRQLTDSLQKSREHTARIMKELFELGLVTRNDATKPFLYQLTDAGRRYLRS